jgi:hypothetical protein
MNLHKRTKHEGLNFPCPECKHTASQKGDLKKHMQSKHSQTKEIEDTQGKKEDKTSGKKEGMEDQRKVQQKKSSRKIKSTPKTGNPMKLRKPREKRFTQEYKKTLKSIININAE